MNLSTHIMFGLLVGALFFGRPEIALMVGVGSAIPDLDREYGFFSKESFRLRQIHRALFHNFLFIGIVFDKPVFWHRRLSPLFPRLIHHNKGPRRRMAIPLFKNGSQSGV